MGNNLRDRVALVLAIATGISLLLLTGAALFDAFANPDSQLSEAYSSLLTGTLGVMVGALAGYIGGRSGPLPTYSVDTDGVVDTSQAGAAAGGGSTSANGGSGLSEPYKHEGGGNG